MGPPGSRDVSRTHSLFVNDLKVYQESHEMPRDINEVLVQTSHDTGTCYGVAKCAEIAFERGKMRRGEGLEVLKKRMKTMDPDENEIYKVLGIEQVDGIKTNDVNLVHAINTKVIPVAAYPMNVCKFTGGELKEPDQVIKRELRSNNMLGKQSSDEKMKKR